MIEVPKCENKNRMPGFHKVFLSAGDRIGYPADIWLIHVGHHANSHPVPVWKKEK